MSSIELLGSFAFSVFCLTCAQKILYLWLIDRNKVYELEEERAVLKTFGDPERIERNQHQYLFQTGVPSTLSSLVILFAFGPIEHFFGDAAVVLPFKIPAFIRGFPPFGMRDRFGWLYLFVIFLILSGIIVGKITQLTERARYSRESKERDKKDEENVKTL